MKITPLICLLFALQLNAATWYAAADGSATNGTYAQPWSVLYATTNTNPYLAAGDTVILKSGTFNAADKATGYTSTERHLVFYASGTAAQPITYRAENLWGFTVNGGLLVPYGVQGLRVEYLNVTQPWTTNRNYYSTNILFSSGWDDYGSNNILQHCIIDNSGMNAVASWRKAHGKTIRGNIMRFPGRNDYKDYGGSSMGSSTYVESEDGVADISGNIAYKSFGGGILFKTYPVGYSVTNNIVFDVAYSAIQWQQNNLPVNGMYVVSNYIWEPNNVGILLGAASDYSGGSGSNLLVQANHVVGGNRGVMFNSWWLEIDFLTNTVTRLQVYPWNANDPTVFNVVALETLGQTNAATYNFAGNTYNYNGGNYPFLYHDASYSQAAWITALTESGSSFTANALPTTLTSYVFRPSDDSNFVHVAVFNWPTNASTTVDLSSFFSAGDSLSVYDAQNVPTAYTNLTYSGSTVALNLSLTNRAEYLGVGWDGFDPRFRAFVVYRSTTNSVIPATAFSGATITSGQVVIQ